MSTKKSFESIGRAIDQLSKNNIRYKNDNTKLASILYGSNKELFYGINQYTENENTQIRDPDDGVVFFLIGLDRVGSAAKTSR